MVSRGGAEGAEEKKGRRKDFSRRGAKAQREKGLVLRGGAAFLLTPGFMAPRLR